MKIDIISKRKIFFIDFNYNFLIIKNKVIKLKILFFVFLLIILLIIFNTLNNKIKVCLCTVGKLENNYIREFVYHYKKYGVDKIFIYDNNDIKGERFDSVLADFMKSNYVEILNYRGIEAKQLIMFQDCYKKNNKNFNWLIFYDIDEFIYLKNFNNIKEFLNLKKFNKCPSIYLNWVIHTDNNLKYYDNRPLYKRFTEKYINKKYCNGKTIIRGNLDGIKMKTTHLLDYKIERCNGFGKKFKPRSIFCITPDYKYYYINHYYSKSTEEFVNKIKKGDAGFGFNNRFKYGRINIYFRFNKITLEKINFIAQKTGLNSSIIINNIKNLFKKNIS